MTFSISLLFSSSYSVCWCFTCACISSLCSVNPSRSIVISRPSISIVSSRTMFSFAISSYWLASSLTFPWRHFSSHSPSSLSKMNFETSSKSKNSFPPFYPPLPSPFSPNNPCSPSLLDPGFASWFLSPSLCALFYSLLFYPSLSVLFPSAPSWFVSYTSSVWASVELLFPSEITSVDVLVNSCY